MADRRHDDVPVNLLRKLLEQEAQIEGHLDRRLGLPQRTRQSLTTGSEGEIRLTKREAQILQLLVAGHTNRQIGTRLHIRAGNVRNHLSRIYRKLGVTRRTQAAVRVVELGLITDDPAMLPPDTDHDRRAQDPHEH